MKKKNAGMFSLCTMFLHKSLMSPPVNLPQDILCAEIFRRLPMKSLVRFLSVCKLWNSLISDPEFITSRFISQNLKNDNLLLDDTCTQRLLNNDHQRHLVVGSINGLVCLTRFSDPHYDFILWNPTIRVFKKILLPKYSLKNRNYMQLYGFGWDSVADDYKIIAARFSSNSWQAVVYSCKKKRWSKKTVPAKYPPPLLHECESPSVVIKGIPYWMFFQRDMILKFEAGISEFTCLTNPVPPRYVIIKLINLNDCLGRIEYDLRSKLVTDTDVYGFDEECSIWSKMYTINDINISWLGFSFSSVMRCYRYGGKIVFNGKKVFDTQSNEIVFDTQSNEIMIRGYYTRSGFWCRFEGFIYTPSLVALKGMKPLHWRGSYRPLSAITSWLYGRQPF